MSRHCSTTKNHRTRKYLFVLQMIHLSNSFGLEMNEQMELLTNKSFLNYKTNLLKSRINNKHRMKD